MRRGPSVDELAAGVVAGDRAMLGRAITLVESVRREDETRAQELLVRLLPHTGRAVRVGLSGVPGAGKSTWIEALGMDLVDRGHRLAVLAVDPSSGVSGGSILGDKTRMAQLAASPRAFIRPSPAAGTLGGVARRTREAMLVCEAAGHDLILVETVGVGQSETAVASMVDVYVVLLLANTGDELQGIKRGILELAHVLVINKADGDNLVPAQRARSQFAAALRFMPAAISGWRTPVLTTSALEHTGLAEVWEAVTGLHATLAADGRLASRRGAGSLEWMWSMVDERVLEDFRAQPAVAAAIGEVEAAVARSELTPTLGAERLLALART